MTLKRGCSRCGEDHFDFEHRHIHPVPQVRLAAPELYADEDEVVEEEAVIEDGENDEADFC